MEIICKSVNIKKIRLCDETKGRVDHEPKSLVNVGECLLLSSHRNEERG